MHIKDDMPPVSVRAPYGSCRPFTARKCHRDRRITESNPEHYLNSNNNIMTYPNAYYTEGHSGISVCNTRTVIIRLDTNRQHDPRLARISPDEKLRPTPGGVVCSFTIAWFLLFFCWFLSSSLDVRRNFKMASNRRNRFNLSPTDNNEFE